MGYKSVVGVLRECFRGAIRVLQDCYTGVSVVSGVLQVCFRRSITGVLQGCNRSVTWVL